MLWLSTALVTGFVGSLHCVGMCGPLAMALPVGRLPLAQRGLGVGLYHAMRVLAYAGLGLAVGSLGQGLLLVGLQRPLSIGAGVFLLIWTLLVRGRFSGLTTTRPTHWITKPMGKFLNEPSLRAFAGLGFLNGLLPCGFVYVALAGAAATGSINYGAAYMMLFGAGTVPALLAIRYVPALIPARLRQRFTRLMPVVAVGLGLLLLVRGIGLPSRGTNGSESRPIPVCHGG